MRIVRSFLLEIILLYLPVAGWCQMIPDSIGQAGVSRSLAVYRHTHLREIRYTLHFRIPGSRQEPVAGQETVSFVLDSVAAGTMPLLLDFRGAQGVAPELILNGKPVPALVQNEHLLLMPDLLLTGENRVEVRFTSGNAALNRNGDYLYTLLVPDRARTLFPCFDQPDLKAVYSLSLVTPAGWRAISNAPLQDSVTTGDSCSWHFRPSDRISSYLFSFVAGRFSESWRVVDGRPIHFLYRETDSNKLRLSLDSIFRIEGQALQFLERYTGVRYPFQKFDMVAIPDFQFGGMEHVGAIQYQSATLFLDSGATRQQLIARSNLLSHETAHMWFGDWVSITWFNDVWMKEVFANFMADKISSVTLPDGNYDLKFLTDHYPAAYSIDRTAGAHPIRQRLDNLQEAGSLYGNIIYHKAPIVMRQLERVMGPDANAFRSGLRDYLRAYAGGNASWPDLIGMLQHHTTVDLVAWNEVWVNGAGRPKFSYRLQTAAGRIKHLVIRQQGEDGSARVWPQVFELALVYKDRIERLPVNMNAREIHLTAAAGKAAPECLLINSDGEGYGLFQMDKRSLPWLSGTDGGAAAPTALMRASAYINLYENMLAGLGLTPRELLAYDRRMLAREPEELDLNILLGHVNSIFWRFLSPATRDSLSAGLEKDCWQALLTVGAGNEKKLLFRTYSNIVLSREGQERLYAIWKDRRPPAGVKLSEDDYTGLAAELAMRNYPGYASILQEQATRIQNKDRKERWLYLQPSLSADTAVRDRFFATLQDAAGRRKEAWVLGALANLHHPLRIAASEKYLPATLDWLEDIQRTGDVFFPQSWLQTSFSFYQAPAAAAMVQRFLLLHPDYNPKLKAKILQATDNLFRAEKLAK